MTDQLHPYPDTTEACARRYAERIRAGIPAMLAEHREHGHDRDSEAAAFMVMAEQGARSYLEYLDQEIAAGTVTMLEVEKADLVETAVRCAGWISATSPLGREAALRELIEERVFGFFEHVPGRWVACYRLVSR